MSAAPLSRRIWFFWTLARLGLHVLLAVAIITACAYVSFSLFISGSYGNAAAVLAVALALIALYFVRLVVLHRNIHVGMRRELKKRNCCPICQYDLRASALRCPECGTSLPAQNVEI